MKKTFTYEMFCDLAEHAKEKIYDEENLIGFVCPYCDGTVYFDEWYDKEVEAGAENDRKCPCCNVAFFKS